MGFDSAQVSAQWLRALRGTRSQLALSRSLGYRTNIVYRWEAGQCAPPAAALFFLLARLRHPIRASLEDFYRSRPTWLDACDPNGTRSATARWASSARLVAALLDDLRGTAAVVHLARSTGFSRFSIARWLAGTSQPSLPQFLALLDACTGRLLDFVACFTSPELLPSLREPWTLLTEARELAYRMPWTHAVLKALSLPEYRALPSHDVDWLADRLGIDAARVDECIAVLERTRQLSQDGCHYVESSPASVDTRSDAGRARELKQWWLEVTTQRLRDGSPGLFSYNLSAVSRADLQRLEQLQRSHYRALRRIIASSEPGECVVLYGAQLLSLERTDCPVPNALPSDSDEAR